ncbi:cell division protein FtsQ/DivIB [Sulfuriflexus sp.]|uniref:cell division protein FtsQ/DivIB n=1 Tax=Sulfuriflexus sp. TaxID=2015443 RepID=UPI0028CFA79A|nr:cell division protein FtsQ/DivIB [Sulfuriflexus sp.]MDT8404324.1 cell division protein FtsQ/DivIB [Sulfuriflexus sp.]
MIRQRRVNQRNSDRVEKRRGVLHLLTGTFGVLVMATGVTWGVMELRDPQTLPLQSVHLKGEFIHITEQELREIIASSDLTGFFSSDLGSLTRRLRNMPWLQQVAVRRVWPDALHITVIEQQAVAYWNDSSLLNTEGQVFSPARESYPYGLPQLNGPAGTQRQVLEGYVSMRAIVQAEERDIDELSLDARRAWQLKLDNGITLALGRTDRQQRLRRFTRAYAGLLDEKQGTISSVDLRYTNGFAVRWQVSEKNAAQADMGLKSHVQES